MIELFDNFTHWHWLALGLAFLTAELLGAAGYLLWLGISALLVGLLLSWLPMSWQLQWVSFAVFSLATTWLWWRRQLKQDKASDASRTLNQKEKQLIGTVVTLEEDVTIGVNRLRVADTTWSARCDQELAAGTRVEIVAIDGIILTIRPITL